MAQLIYYSLGVVILTENHNCIRILSRVVAKTILLEYEHQPLMPLD